MNEFQFAVKKAFRYAGKTYMPGARITAKDEIGINEIKTRRKWGFILPANDAAKALISERIITRARADAPGQASAQDQGKAPGIDQEQPQAQGQGITDPGTQESAQEQPKAAPGPGKKESQDHQARPGKDKGPGLIQKAKAIFKKKK